MSNLPEWANLVPDFLHPSLQARLGPLKIFPRAPDSIKLAYNRYYYLHWYLPGVNGEYLENHPERGWNYNLELMLDTQAPDTKLCWWQLTRNEESQHGTVSEL